MHWLAQQGSQPCSDMSGGRYYNNVFRKADTLKKASSTLTLQAVLPDEMPDILPSHVN